MKNDIMKRNLLYGLIGILLFAFFGMLIYLFLFNSKEIQVIEIDKTDHTYFLKNIDNDFSFQIHTSYNDYDIYDVNNHKIEVVKKYSDSVLTIKFNNNYKENNIYFIKLRDKDLFVDERLKNARIIYFGSNDTLTNEKLNYEVAHVNIKDSYILKNNKISLGDLTAKLSIKSLNKNINLKLKKYRVFIDNSETTASAIKVLKGKHKIKIQFNYDNKKYKYEKEINVKELFGGLSDKQLLSLAKKYYKRAYYLSDYEEAITTNENDTKYYDLCHRILTYDGKKVSSKKDLQNVYYQFFDKSVPFEQAYVYTYVQYYDGKPYHMLAEGSLEGVGDLTYYKVTRIKKKTENTIVFNVELKLENISYIKKGSNIVILDSPIISKKYNDEFTMRYVDGKWKVSQFKMRGRGDWDFYKKY